MGDCKRSCRDKKDSKCGCSNDNCKCSCKGENK